MNKASESLVVIVGVIGGVFLMSCVGGVILFFVWPVAIPVAFPGLVFMGIVAPKLTMWTSICLTWVFNILFKVTTTPTKK